MLGDVPAQLRGCLLPARKQGPQLAPWDLLSFSPPSKVGPAFLLRRWHRLRGMNGNFLLPGPSQHDSGRLRLEKLNQSARRPRISPNTNHTDYFQRAASGSAEFCPLWTQRLSAAAQKMRNEFVEMSPGKGFVILTFTRCEKP